MDDKITWDTPVKIHPTHNLTGNGWGTDCEYCGGCPTNPFAMNKECDRVPCQTCKVRHRLGFWCEKNEQRVRYEKAEQERIAAANRSILGRLKWIATGR